MKRSNDRNNEQLQFDIRFRTQFTFIVNDQTLACILNNIAKNSINIVGFFSTRRRDKRNFVRLVAGTTDSENIRDLRVVREALDSHHVKFKEEEIIALLNIPPGIPGVFNLLFGSLWCKVNVKSLYIGEKDTIFITVSNIKKATEILTHGNLKRCFEDC
jgi:hypothetical protein